MTRQAGQPRIWPWIALFIFGLMLITGGSLAWLVLGGLTAGTGIGLATRAAWNRRPARQPRHWPGVVLFFFGLMVTAGASPACVIIGGLTMYAGALLFGRAIWCSRASRPASRTSRRAPARRSRPRRPQPSRSRRGDD